MLRRRRNDGDGNQWTLAEGEYDGRPIITRFEHVHRRKAGRGGRPFRVGVAVELTTPDERGYPAQVDEGDRLAALEERIIELAADRAVLVGVITTGGTREWVLYAATHDWLEDFHHSLDEQTEGYEVQVVAEHDPSWSVYDAFV